VGVDRELEKQPVAAPHAFQRVNEQGDLARHEVRGEDDVKDNPHAAHEGVRQKVAIADGNQGYVGKVHRVRPGNLVRQLLAWVAQHLQLLDAAARDKQKGQQLQHQVHRQPRQRRVVKLHDVVPLQQRPLDEDARVGLQKVEIQPLPPAAHHQARHAQAVQHGAQRKEVHHQARRMDKPQLQPDRHRAAETRLKPIPPSRNVLLVTPHHIQQGHHDRAAKARQPEVPRRAHLAPFAPGDALAAVRPRAPRKQCVLACALSGREGNCLYVGKL
jgi:hypothetical protein